MSDIVEGDGFILDQELMVAMEAMSILWVGKVMVTQMLIMVVN
jgi:hypothetical protein